MDDAAKYIVDDVASHLMALGPCKTYLNCMTSDESCTRVILSKLTHGGHLKTCILDHTAVDAAKDDLTFDGKWEISTERIHDVLSIGADSLGGVFLDLRAFAPTCHTMRNAPIGVFAPLDSCVGSSIGISASEWLFNVSVEQLAWVIDSFGVLFDPLLSERIAEAIVMHQQERGAYTSTSELQNALDDLKSDFQEEHPMLNVAWIVRAIRVFINNETQILNLAMERALETLEPHGRLVIMSTNIWELEAVRRFIAEHEEPNTGMIALLPLARLQELYPQLERTTSYCIRNAAPPQQYENRGLLHVLEKVQFSSATLSDAIILESPSRGLVERDHPFCEPPPPQFRKSDANVDGSNVSVVDTLGRALNDVENEELKDLQRCISERKAQLKAGGMNSSQQKKDPLVAEWITRVNKLHNQGPRYLAQIQARCRDRGHVSVLLEDAIENLMTLGADKLYVDCTFGRGGHTKLLLSKLSCKGRLKAFDIDPLAVEVAHGIAQLDERFEILHRPFSDLSTAVQEPVAGVLLDLGVSTPQLQDCSRGFSFASKMNGPLDLRMNQEAGLPASEWLQTVSSSQLAWVFHTCGHALEPILAQRVAEGILQHQERHGPYKTTHQLASFLDNLMPTFQEEFPRLSLQKAVFVALRVFLNQEMTELDRVLDSTFQLLECFGRCVIITFNKFERLTIRSFLRDHEEPTAARFASLPKERLAQMYPLLASSKDYSVRRCMPSQQPLAEEVSANQRSRDARLHVLEKIPRKYPIQQCMSETYQQARGSTLARARFCQPPPILAF